MDERGKVLLYNALTIIMDNAPQEPALKPVVVKEILKMLGTSIEELAELGIQIDLKGNLDMVDR